MKTEELYNKKCDCAGCSACMNICPQKAIIMKEDENGYIYPKIDETKCINCGLCQKTCAYQNYQIEGNSIKAYASFNTDEKSLKKSSSGGVFASLASDFLKKGGIVYGCAMEHKEELLVPMHIRVDKVEELWKLQGSKYVKSVIDFSYIDVKEQLKNGKKVLFSGTPCQVAALKKYLSISNVNTDNIYYIDLICHGTPSTRFFQDYIRFIENKKKFKILDLKFRNKRYGWGLKGTITYKKPEGRIKEKVFYNRLSSYYNYFLKGKTYRENCYSCKYANIHRNGDITIGDYWGIEIQHPEYLKDNGGKITITKGISCILVNSKKGEKLLEDYGKKLVLLKSSIGKIVEGNQQLTSPCDLDSERNTILKIYREKGYGGVEKYYRKRLGFKRSIYRIYYFFKDFKNRI